MDQDCRNCKHCTKMSDEEPCINCESVTRYTKWELILC